MNVITSKISSLIQYQQVKVVVLDRWMSQRVSNEKKMSVIIALHNIPQETNKVIQTSISQYNQMRGKMTSKTKYRKEIFKDIIECIKSMEGPVDVIIGGDCNQ